jgi:hypothetical protein
VDITVYLPDALGERAKEQNINLSRTLRDAIEEELEMRDAMKTTLEDTQVYEVELEDGTTGRITGTRIATDWKDGDEVYLTEDERVLYYDAQRERVREIEDPQEELRNLDGEQYSAAAAALGFKPVIDL